MKLIGLTGGMGSGKSTAVEILKELYGEKNVTLLKFAQPLYDMQSYIYQRINTIHPVLNSGDKDRFLLQFLGTEWGRQRISQSLWIDLWKAHIKRFSNSAEHIVVSDDVRYDNEAEAVKSLGGVVIEIISHRSALRIDTAAGIPSHISENGVDPDLVEYAVVNNGSIEEFKKSLTRTFGVALLSNV